jgi:uncharacterized circularly permuted ATP-grasp superfamily protein
MEQRSRLLNALLADLYGPRLAIRQGWLPPELIYASPWLSPRLPPIAAPSATAG